LKAINDIHDRLNRECGGAVVSCSDVLALAARDSVVVVIDLPLTPLAVLLFCSLY
jgi:hypothetical protein